MNREDVIRMAEEAGITNELIVSGWGEHWIDMPIQLERFAALVYAEGHKEGLDDFEAGVLPAAIKAEREACAKVAEDTGNISGNMNKTWRNGCFDAADAIRARGQE